MQNLLRNVTGNIYGMGVYCFKDEDGIVRYVGSGQMNDRLSSHLYNLKRGFYEGTNKDILQSKYNLGLLSFEVLHFSQNNSVYENGTIEEKKAIQEALGILEQFYVDMYHENICNKMMEIKKTSSSPNARTTEKRRKANTGCNNPNNKYDEELIQNVIWMKDNGYNPKRIIEILLEKDIEMDRNYIYLIGRTRWKKLNGVKPSFIHKIAE